jgi:Type III secretion system lipoprotein chaperone (YscW)
MNVDYPRPQSSATATAAGRPGYRSRDEPFAAPETRVIVVEVVAEGAERPPPGSILTVRVLDTTYADAPAAVVAEATAHVSAAGTSLLQTVELDPPPAGAGDYRVRAHVDVDGDGTVSPGDFVSTASYPVPKGEPLQVVVRKV